MEEDIEEIAEDYRHDPLNDVEEVKYSKKKPSFFDKIKGKAAETKTKYETFKTEQKEKKKVALHERLARVKEKKELMDLEAKVKTTEDKVRAGHRGVMGFIGGGYRKGGERREYRYAVGGNLSLSNEGRPHMLLAGKTRSNTMALLSGRSKPHPLLNMGGGAGLLMGKSKGNRWSVGGGKLGGMLRKKGGLRL
jgi:hypothetical protein